MRRRMPGLSGFVWPIALSLLLLAAPVPAQDIPPALGDWQGWVLHDVPQHGCPFLAGQTPGSDNRQCAWPGRMSLEAGKDGGHFTLDVHVDAPSWVALPGDAKNWPQQVMLDRQPATVLQRNDQPMLWLTPGEHQLSGSLPWNARPARLRVPQSIGLVTLKVDGAAVSRIERNGEQLTLGEAAAAQRAADALSLRVYRRLEDGLPGTLLTQLQFNVTGSAREQSLGPVLPDGFVATSLFGELPSRLDNDGQLRVQLRPGQWTITLAARSAAPLSRIALKLPAAPWPRQEVWSYVDAPALRSTRVEGNATDAAQAGVPAQWSQLPAFVLDDHAGLAIEQGTRGDEGGKGDQLHLQRQLWLDFDGGGLSIVDHLGGELRHRQRLDVAAPWQLQRASQDDEPLLISRSGQGRSGVELREQDIDLGAGLRLPMHGGRIPTAGWQVPLEDIDATLHLPHGYRLLGAIGADRSPDSWVAQWDLLDLFVVAVIALLAGRLLGWPWALLAAGFLALARHEVGVPLWTLATALALGLLLAALPEGRLRRTARFGALAGFALAVLWALPFAAAQLQYALHPQLEGGQQGAVMARFEPAGQPPPKIVAQAAPPPTEEAYANASMPPPMPAADARSSSARGVVSGKTAAALSAIAVEASAVQDLGGSLAAVRDDLDARNVVQAGAGMPSWNQGNNYRLGWSGPVTAEQTTRLLIVPSWLVRLLRVVMVGLLAALLGRLVPRLLPASRISWPGGRRGASVVGAALFVALLLPTGSRAQSLPDAPLLEQLRNRLTEAPPCAPACAAVAQAQLQVNGDVLDVALEIHVGAAVALPLPQADDALQLFEVSVDGHADAPIVRRGDRLLLRLDRGVHRVGLRYRIGSADTASLRFDLRPQRVSFDGQGWLLDGVSDGRALGDSIALHRVRAGNDGGSVAAVQSFPPYVRLIRTLELGVDWTVTNEVQRIAPREGGFSISIPLLPGEHPVGDDVLVKDGRINITFNASSGAVTWRSRLDHVASLVLKAPALGERAEAWQIQAAPMWHVEAKGVPTSASDDGLLFQPLPGETLQLAFTQPQAIAGDSLAFDRVQVTTVAGERASETTLELHARSTRGGEHAIDLPAGAELLDANRDGESINLAVRDGKLGLPLLPGEHDYTLRLREPRGVAARTRTPTFALHAPVANIGLDLQLPQDRWVLWTWGPTTGPAVLYWSQLVVLLLAAWLLARFAPTPLRFRHWLLLGLGFSAFAWSAYALVVLWLILLGLRARHAPAENADSTRFNLLQVGLAALTVLALLVLIAAVPKGLLGLPDMHVVGNGSAAASLRWFADQSAGLLPGGGVFSVSLWFYKLAMLIWALWLANALIGWLQWAFKSWTHGGYWRKPLPKPGATPPQLPPNSSEPPHA
ncbi:hypothetical protein ABNK63_13205 [Rhodanobacter sp. IGA1.0]|uniref:Uncharacterized protein n=1 Tax=Rhodanobacter sp. IGA1.0 TaxID=3158582 RepID=A0AAU7QL78_9GAMM